ncbi:ABC transporter ATP-binding protein [Microlunatus sp. Y2014]|uniref:ABC transporter ATP-binding protein n=1 Tax=Microlunatus sp. Y2014 TaxID=3418488 RepID=UPI003DA79436
MTTLNLTGLTKRFGTVNAVTDLTLTAAPGKVTAFLGPNGAGKSTTLRMALGLIRPDSGAATFDGLAYDQLPRPTRTVGAVLDLAGAHPAMTARRHLRVNARLRGHDVSRVAEVLTDTGLDHAADRRVGGFSTGMRQRLALATALLGDPDVLVLDEPTNGLDPAGIRWLRRVLTDRARRGRTVLVSSHHLSEVALSADDVVIIGDGRLRWHGPLNELTDDHASLEDAFLDMAGAA